MTIECSGPAGTVRYMAPEIAKADDYGVSADIYSFAILLWELITLRIPFKRFKTRDSILDAVKSGRRPSIQALPTNKELRKLVNACWDGTASKRLMAKDIRHRLTKILDEPRNIPFIRRAAKRRNSLSNNRNFDGY
eukprot:CAMPEP_0116568194 /NCGR_PEP_ID=MMETSP0397-20121206/15484_1 /TAXON_ID=216820 /ORGANISM="Cyclophora tenuis, Strain ECT3854" /LENGTH=135 /DNA_ID=CAMNT_0004095383 /DNA_START=54 /DNA_END=461 /DNA_ORIENTATION=+